MRMVVGWVEERCRGEDVVERSWKQTIRERVWNGTERLILRVAERAVAARWLHARPW